MAIINQLECTTFSGNTGFGKCFYQPAPRKYAIEAPKGSVLTAEQLVDIEATFRSLLVHDDPAQRYHSFGAFEDWEDQAEDRQQQTFGSGRKVTTRDPTEQMVFRLYDGGLCTQKNILDFDNAHTGYDTYYVDANNYLQAEATYDNAGKRALKGFHADEFYAFPMKQPTGSEVASYRISIAHGNAKAMQRRMAVIPLGFNFDMMRMDYAMQNATLENVTPNGAASGVFHIQVMGGCGNDNLTALYPVLLANIARFTVYNRATGAPITITSATANADKTAIILALNTADTDYPVVGPNGKIGFGLALPSVLGTAGIKWYEAVIPANFKYPLELLAT